MTKITLNGELSDVLAKLTHPVELCDAHGTVLGRFNPAIADEVMGRLEPQVDVEELRRRMNSTEWFTTAEVIEKLEQL